TLSGLGLRGSIAAGEDKYNEYCAVCHGATGKGDGPVATNLDPPPTDFTDPEVMENKSYQDLFNAVRRGGGAIHRSIYMPRWGEQLTDQDIWDMVEYLKRLRSS
ncbi:MAG: c-type cytochrome, partial [Anaerolineae bacterium]|nr:c-type cytochrome [Anaerolineae bacterium]NIQ81615.1 c-type cytochrome [Anaerolineae bacterium]